MHEHLLITIMPTTSQYCYRRLTIIGIDQYGQVKIDGVMVPVPLSRQEKRYLAVKRKQHKHPFTPRLSCQRSSRRLAVLAKRKRLGLPPDGKIFGYSRGLSYIVASAFGQALTMELTGYQWQS